MAFFLSADGSSRAMLSERVVGVGFFETTPDQAPKPPRGGLVGLVAWSAPAPPPDQAPKPPRGGLVGLVAWSARPAPPTRPQNPPGEAW